MDDFDFETCEHGNAGHCPVCYQEWQADYTRRVDPSEDDIPF